MVNPPFPYAGARLQARYGQRPTAALWGQLEAIDNFGRFIQAARDTVLRPWVMNFGVETGPHRIELHLRTRYRTLVFEVAGWQPWPWRDFIRWLSQLPDLPITAHRLAGGEGYGWLEQPAADSPQRRASPIGGTREIPISDGDAGGVARRWLEHWRSLRPARDKRYGLGLTRLEHTLAESSRALQAWVEAGEGSGEPQRRVLGERLNRIFRRHTRQPAGAAAYLLLALLDMHRLRGGLLRRRLLG